MPAPIITEGLEVLVQLRDRRDHDVPVVELEALGAERHGHAGVRGVSVAAWDGGAWGGSTARARVRATRWRAGSEAG